MADNKIRLLKILDIIKDTDEDSPITASEIINILNKEGISIERKAVYSSIHALIENGYDIESFQGNKSGYYLKDRDFEEWELKVLIDAVVEMKFLNPKDIQILINKIKKLAGNSGRKVLASSTLSNSLLENKKEKFYVKNNIDIVMRAINRKRKLSFQYTYINEKMERKLRYDGKIYIVNPYALVMQRNQYYLICNYEKYDELSYYRLDRIKSAEILEDKPIKKLEEIIGDDIERALNDFVNKSIYQFSGETIRLKLKIKSWLIEEIIDYFDYGLRVYDYDDEYMKVEIKVCESNGLYYWLMQHEPNIEVIEPQSVRNEIKCRLLEAIKIYED